MLQSLNNLLEEKHIVPRVCLIHAPEACYPYVCFALQHLYNQFGTANRYRFIADRYFNFDEVNKILGNYSLFEEKNLIEINYKTKPTTAQDHDLSTLIEKIDANTCFIITTEKLPSISSNWIKTFNQYGNVIGITEKDTPAIIKYRVVEAGLRINNSAINLLIELNQANLAQLMQELSRLLLLYPKDHEININDIQRIDNSEYNIYQLSSAYLSGNLRQSLKILDNIYVEASDAILIMWIINDDIRKLIKIKGKLKEKINIDIAINGLKVWGLAINNLKIAAERLPYKTLLSLLDQLATLDLMIKGVVDRNVRTHLTSMITTLCATSQPSHALP